MLKLQIESKENLRQFPIIFILAQIFNLKSLPSRLTSALLNDCQDIGVIN